MAFPTLPQEQKVVPSKGQYLLLSNKYYPQFSGKENVSDYDHVSMADEARPT